MVTVASRTQNTAAMRPSNPLEIDRSVCLLGCGIHQGQPQRSIHNLRSSVGLPTMVTKMRRLRVCSIPYEAGFLVPSTAYSEHSTDRSRFVLRSHNRR